MEKLEGSVKDMENISCGWHAARACRRENEGRLTEGDGDMNGKGRGGEGDQDAVKRCQVRCWWWRSVTGAGATVTDCGIGEIGRWCGRGLQKKEVMGRFVISEGGGTVVLVVGGEAVALG